MSIDLNNPEFVAPFSPAAAWKRALIVHLGGFFNLRTLVETGTCWGDTVGEVRHAFTDVWSIELSPTFYNHAKNRFADDPHVHLIFGSSGEMLSSIIEQTTSPLLFWLDAHPTGGPSADNGDQAPLELDIIARMRPDSLVLIDDVRPEGNGYASPGSHVIVPDGWQTRFLSGVLALHAGGYAIPEKF